MPQEPAWLTSEARMAKRRQPRESEGQDGRSERPAMGLGQPRPATGARLAREPYQATPTGRRARCGSIFANSSCIAATVRRIWSGVCRDVMKNRSRAARSSTAG